MDRPDHHLEIRTLPQIKGLRLRDEVTMGAMIRWEEQEATTHNPVEVMLLLSAHQQGDQWEEVVRRDSSGS